MLQTHMAAAVAAQTSAPGMRLGVNLSGISSWANAWMFNNLMYHANYPELTSGTGTFTYDQGYISATDSSSVRRVKFADNQSQLPSGGYTVLNPAGDLIAIGDYGEPSSALFTRSTQFTFNLPAGSSNTLAKSLFVKGNLTGNVAIIMPGCLELWQNGNIWNPQFLTFLHGLKPSIIRTMDWNIASDNIESEWAHRTVPGKPCIRNAATNWFGGCAPYEFMFDLAARINADIWLNVPHRASTDYVTKLGQLINEKLPTGRRVWIEPVGNEIWNYASPWAIGSLWIDFHENTRRIAAIDAANNRYTLANHGLTDGEQILCFDTIENRTALAWRDYRLTIGGVYVKVIDANTFEAYTEAALTNKLPVGTRAQNLLFVKEVEAGKTRNINTGYSKRALEVFDALESVVAPSKLVRLIASQVANTSTASGRWTYSNVASRADYLTGAPYFSGPWFGASITPTDGQLAVGFWCNNNATIKIGLYPAGATPTVAEINAGTGAIATQSYSYTSGGAGYSTAATFAGLTAGTTYSVHIVVTAWSLKDKLSGSAVASAGSTVYLTLPYERQALRNKLSVFSNRGGIASNQAISSPKKFVFYECGLHFHEAAPENIKAWLNGYLESPEMQSCVRAHLQDAANQGVAAACYFSDASTTTFRLADNYADTADLKYLAFAAFNGRVKKAPLLTASDILAPNLAVRPGSFPAVVSALPAGPESYTIVDGDDGSNFAVVGSNLVMVNDNGVNWVIPASRTVRIAAQSNHVIAPFNVQFSTGDAWYAADASLAWNSTTDTDGAQIDLQIGVAPLTLKTATPAPISGGLWDMDGARYSGTSMTTGLRFDQPFVVAAVLDRDNQTSFYAPVLQIGSGNFVSFYTDSGAATAFCAHIYYNSGGVTTRFKSSGTLPTGAHVYWVYSDGAGNYTAGIDQTNGNTVVKAAAATGTSSQVFVGSDDAGTVSSQMKHGSMHVLRRTSLSIDDAKAIVAKMQALHGIP